MYLSARSTTMNPQQLTEYLTQVIQPRFTTVEASARCRSSAGANSPCGSG
jgi:hypothetical protein